MPDLGGDFVAVLVDGLSWVLLTAGALFYLIGAIGMNRMPDLFTRMHAVSVSDTLGVALLVLGMMMQAGFTLVSIKLAFILVTLFLSGPVASHALARAALHDGQRPLLAGRDGKLRETDPVELFPELQGRLGHPLSSETNDPDTAAAVAAAPEREARPSNS